MNKYRVSVLTTNGQFMIGSSNGTNELSALSTFMYRAGLSHDNFIEIQMVRQYEDGELDSKMIALNCKGQVKMYPTIEDMFVLKGDVL